VAAGQVAGADAELAERCSHDLLKLGELHANQEFAELRQGPWRAGVVRGLILVAGELFFGDVRFDEYFQP
jgi:hypothetical protein